jgi:predicted nucleic acid-binding protein
MARYAYLDASAIAKLIVVEPESSALENDLAQRAGLVASRLGGIEVRRAVRRSGRRRLLQQVDDVFQCIVFVEMSAAILQRAGAMEPATLRTLDAIHLATAESLDVSPMDLITYDARFAAAATAHGLSVCQPGR